MKIPLKRIEKQYRLDEASALTGKSIQTIRRKIRLREIGYQRNGKIITIPASELASFMGKYFPPLSSEQKSV